MSKLIIAGTRNIDDYQVLIDAIEASGFDMDSFDAIVSGCALGADTLGIRYAMETKKKVLPFPVSAADWIKHKKAAGPIRNQRMSEVADALIAMWDGSSPGTKDMISRMVAAKKNVYVHMVLAPGAPTLENL